MLETLHKDGYLEYKIIDDKNFPFLQEGDLVLIKPDPNKFSVGDMVLCKRDGEYYIARINKVYVNGYSVRQDFCYKPIGFIGREEMYAKIESVIKKDSTNEILVDTKKYKFLVKIYNFILFRYANIFCIKAFLKIRDKIKQKKKEKAKKSI